MSAYFSALNVGLTAGLIHQRLFTILVLMALVNTLATAPLLTMIRPAAAPAPQANAADAALPESIR
jgi:hypothetical protein